MPLYAHKCPRCGSEFDDLRPLAEYDTDVPCPRCGTPSPRTLVAPAFKVHGDNAANGYGLRRATP